jgi:Cu(I)/Ag(I) efflux system membrane fusion protein
MSTARTTVIAIVVLAAVSASAIVAYRYRDRIGFGAEDHSTMNMPADAPAVGTASPSPASVARGDVTIDPQRQQLIGVRTVPVTRESMGATVRTTGAVRYDERRQTDVNVKLDGWIRDLYVDYTGQPIQRGQRLFTFYSPDLLAAQNEFLLALKARDQAKASTINDAREYADRLIDAARQRLALWDLSAEDVAAIERDRRPKEAITFSSPASGVVLEKQAVKGMHVTPGQTLYKVADLSTVWVEADVYEQEVASARVGQRATITVDAYPGESFQGRAIYIYPFVEENTRTVKVRFELPNMRGRLKPGMFANVELQGTPVDGLTVPVDAVLDSGTQQVVFIAQGEGTFTPRAVKVGRRLGDRTQILEGVKEGEQVAAAATFFLDSESQLRAGLQNYESAQPAQPAAAGPIPSITFRTTTDPPKTGENVFEVSVKDDKGQAIADADVAVVLFMPAMPTMNMPAMRNETKLTPAGNGLYRGPGQVMMGGRWDVTVNVTRNGQRVGSKQFALVAK